MFIIFYKNKSITVTIFNKYLMNYTLVQISKIYTIKIILKNNFFKKHFLNNFQIEKKHWSCNHINLPLSTRQVFIHSGVVHRVLLYLNTMIFRFHISVETQNIYFHFNQGRHYRDA